MIIYHVVLPEDWENYKDQAEYEATSLHSEGFIHCSFNTQLDGVLERYYKGVKRVFLLKLDTDKLTSKLVYETSTGHEIFPHIYGKINRDAIIKVEEKMLALNERMGF